LHPTPELVLKMNLIYFLAEKKYETSFQNLSKTFTKFFQNLLYNWGLITLMV